MELKVSEAIIELRMAKNMTQEELSEASDLNLSLIQWIESEPSGFSRQIIERIASALGVPSSFVYLLAEKSDNPLVMDLQDAVRKSIQKG